MREIKFRAQNFGGHWIYSEKVKLAVFFDYLECDNPVTNKRTLGQYTGLRDKNGREIYEGDILEVYNDYDLEKTKHEVVWGGIDYPAFCLKPNLGSESNDFSELVNSGYSEYQVIGNIHENPEALNEEGNKNDHL